MIADRGTDAALHGLGLALMPLAVRVGRGATAQAVDLAAALDALRQAEPRVDLAVLPEGTLTGAAPDGRAVGLIRRVCRANRLWTCLPVTMPVTDGRAQTQILLIDATGEVRRAAGPVLPGPRGSRLAILRGADAVDADRARAAAEAGAEVLIRLAAPDAPFADIWGATGEAQAFCNLVITASLGGGGGGAPTQALVMHVDGTPTAAGTGPAPLVAHLRPDLVRAARRFWADARAQSRAGRLDTPCDIRDRTLTEAAR